MWLEPQKAKVSKVLLRDMDSVVVKVPGEGVHVTARSDDGIVEAYEYGDQVVSFQFHPEGLARTDASWLAPFRYLVRRILLAD